MKYMGKWYQKVFRYLQVKWYLFTKRYRPVEGGINFYADMRKGGVGEKGYYWKPMSYTTPVDFTKFENLPESVTVIKTMTREEARMFNAKMEEEQGK